MKKKVLHTLILGALFISATLTGVMAADTPSAKSRTGLYNRTTVENTSSSPSTEASSLYAPLRASGDLGAGGRPDINEGIGAATPIGEIPGVILFAVIAAYLGFVFVRKQRELRVKN